MEFFTVKELEWRSVEGFDGYSVSEKGHLKSLSRVVVCKNGVLKPVKEKLKSSFEGKDGYLYYNLYKNNKKTNVAAHQLVAMAFLNHKRQGFEVVVNHKNFNKKDNHYSNLELVTNRENSNQAHIESSSKYVGVYFSKKSKLWVSMIREPKGKKIYLGSFQKESDASKAYQNKLKEYNK